MITYESLKTKPGLLKNFTGLSHRGFKKLAVAFDQAYTDELKAQEEEREAPRQRRVGGGRKGALPKLAACRRGKFPSKIFSVETCF